MSYVLDALKKSERERQVNKTSPDGGDVSPVRPNRRWQGVVLIIGAALTLAAGFYIGQSGTKPDTKTTSSEPTKEQPDKDSTIVRPNKMELPTTPLTAELLPTTKQPVQTDNTHRPVQTVAQTATTPATATMSRRYQTSFPANATKIISGCTIGITTQQNHPDTVQLAGISCLPPQTVVGQEAVKFVTRLILMKNIVIAILKEQNTQATMVDVFDMDNALLNRTLVRQGLASATEDRFRDDETEARSARRGMWQKISR